MNILFRPIRVKNIEIKNRLVRSATGEGMCTGAGDVTPALVEYNRKVAGGGIGLFITGHTFIEARGKASEGMMGAWRDEQVPGLRELANAIRKAGAVSAIQLNHAGRQTSASITGVTPVAPSAVTDRSSGVTPRELSEKEILELIEYYVRSAVRSREAGFDMVQLHCAHGYLMSQFISPYTNRRTDRWGGSLQNRSRFVIEVLRKCRSELGNDYPILIKLNCRDFIDGGLEFEDTLQFARMLEENTIDAIEVSGAIAESVRFVLRKNITSPEDEGYFLEYSKELKKALKLPVICTGGFRSKKVMEDALEKGRADMIGLCRPLIRQPDLPDLLRNDVTEKADCISCNKCHRSKEEGLGCSLLN